MDFGGIVAKKRQQYRQNRNSIYLVAKGWHPWLSYFAPLGLIVREPLNGHHFSLKNGTSLNTNSKTSTKNNVG
jgi:hypothetical protein